MARNNIRFIAAVIVLAMSLFGEPAFAEFYKCTSTSGAVTYQQTPCQGVGDKVKVIKPLPPPSAEDQMRAENRLNQLEERQAERQLQQQIQHQKTTSGGNDVGTFAGQSFGDCASEQGMCISQCTGNAQCIDNCVAAHGRCVGNAASPKHDVGQCMGYCASEQGMCISQCNGNGQCIGNCAAAHGRCVAHCN